MSDVIDVAYGTEDIDVSSLEEIVDVVFDLQEIHISSEESPSDSVVIEESIDVTVDEELVDVSITDLHVDVTTSEEIIDVLGVGEAGPAGRDGADGADGADGGSYVHAQNTPAAVWTIVHNLGYRPGGILIIDSAGTEWQGEIAHLDLNTLTITFTVAFGGTAYLS